jgi:Ca2+-binding RTX toxin-like protein
MAISTNGAIITRLAGALYNEYLSNASYVEVSTTAPATVAANWLSNDFASKTDAQIATTVLTNLSLNTVAGLDNWVAAQLTAAGSSAAAKGAKLVSMLNDYSQMTADATYGASATSFNAKVTASLTLSQTTGAKGGAFGTSDATAVSTIALTTGVDLGSKFVGGAGNDSFTSTQTTLTAGDSLDGGAGTDTLSLVSAPTATDALTIGTGAVSTGIETLAITATTAAATVKGAGHASLATVTNNGSTIDVTVDGLVAIPTVNLTGTSAPTTVAVVSTKTVNLSGAATGTTLTADAIETFAVAASSDSAATFAGTGLTSVTLSGAGKVTGVVNFNGSGVASTATGTVNASAATTGTAFTVTAPTSGKLALTGSATTDSFTMGSITGLVTLAGGEGNDTLVINTNTTVNATDLANVTGVENLTVGTSAIAANGITIATANSSAISKVTLAGGVGSSGATISGLDSGDSVVLTKANTGTLTLSVTGATTGTADSISVTVGSSTAAPISGGTLAAASVETIAFTSSGNDLTAATPNTVNLSGQTATTVTVAGAEEFTLTAAGASLTKYDASAATGAQNTGSITFATAGAAITGGSANDTLTGGDGNDTVSGGAGNDSITGGAGADNLTGGAGVDTFVVADGNSTSTKMDTITDFTVGSDKLSIGQTNTKFVGTFSSVQEGLAAMTAANQSFFVSGTNQFYVVATQGTLQASDDIVKLSGVTAITGADLGIGSQGAGNSITLTAANATVTAATATNATGKATAGDDSISTVAAYLGLTTGTIEGGTGADSLTVTDGGTVNVTRITGIETLDLSGATAASTITNVPSDMITIKLSSKGDDLQTSLTATLTNVTGGAGDDKATLGDYSSATVATVVGGAGNDTITIGAVASTNALVLDGGTGTADKLGVTATKTAVLTGSTVTGFEILGSGSAGSAEVVTITAGQFSSLSSFDLGANADDRLKLSGQATYDLTAKTVTSAMEVEVLTAGSTIRANAAQLGDAVVGTGATGGDTLAIANDAAFTATGVTKIQTITYAGAGTNALTIAQANVFAGADGTTATDGAKVITGTGTSDLIIAGITNAGTVNTTASAISGFDSITFTNDNTGDVLLVDPADIAGSTLVSTGTNANLTVFNGATAAGTVAQDLSTITITDDDFDTLTFGANTASYVTNLTVSEKAMVSGIANVIGTTNGTEGLIVTASTATAAITLAAVTTVTDLNSITVNGGSGNNTITVPDVAGVSNILTINLGQGGSDTVSIASAAIAALANNEVTINGFTAGSGTGSDVIKLTGYAGFATVTTTSATAGTALKVTKVASAVATISDFTATADGGNVEVVLADAINFTGLTNDNDVYVVIGGSGANSGNTALYRIDVTTAANEVMVVSLEAILVGVSVDDLGTGNFTVI